MNKAVPWHVKGVGFDTREAARLAARRAGLPVGQWLDSVISERAADLGVRIDDIDPGDRLEALTARLSELAESGPHGEGQTSEPSNLQRSVENEDPASAAGISALSPATTGSDRDAQSKEFDMDRDAVGRSHDEVEGGELSLQDRGAASGDDGAARRRARRDGVGERRPASDRRPTRSRVSAALKPDAGETSDFEDDRESLAQRGDAPREGAPPIGAAGRHSQETLGTMVDRLSALESRFAKRDYGSAHLPPSPIGRFDHLMRRTLENTPEATRVESTFRTLDGRLSALARRMEQSDGRPSSRSNAEIERIDGKLASILSRLNQTSNSQHGQDVTSAVIRSGGLRTRDEWSGKLRPRMRNAVADIARRQADLDQSSSSRAALLNETSYNSIGQAQRDQRIGADLSNGNRSGITVGGVTHDNLDDAFRALSERLEARLDQAAKARPAAGDDSKLDFAGLQGEIGALGDRLDRLQSERGLEEANPRITEMLDTLRGEVVSLAKSVVDLASRSAVGPLEEAIRNLAGRIEVSRLDGIEAAVLAPVERLGAEIREAIAGLDARTEIEGLSRQLKSIAWNIDTMQGRGLDESALALLQEQTQSVREAVLEAAKAPPFALRIEQQLGTLGERLERLSEAPAGAGSADLDRAIVEIRAMIEKSAPDAYFERIDRKMDDLAIRIDGTAGTHGPQAAMFDDLSRKIEDTHASLAARLSARVGEPVVDLEPLETLIGGLSEKIDSLNGASAEMRTIETLSAQLSARTGDLPVDLQPLEAMISGLTDKIDSLSGTSAEMRTLDTLIRGLMLQIEEARLPTSDVQALDALESQVERLAERLDRSDAGLNAISSLERVMGDLFQELEETRNVAIDAAEHAARTAAQDTLRAAMSSPSINGKDIQLQTSLVVEQVSQEFSEFRRAQEASEKRVHGTLKSLSSTLERLVDRMIFDMQSPAGKAKTFAPAEAAMDAADTSLKVEHQPTTSDEDAPSTAEPRVVRDAVAAPEGADVANLDRPIEKVPAAGEAAPLRRIAPSVEIGRAPTMEISPQVSPLIAAARRAAQAAQTSAAAARPKLDTVRDRVSPDPATSSFFAQKRRPLLLGLAGVVLLLGAIQIVRLATASHTGAAPMETTAPVVDDKPDRKSDLSTDKADAAKVASNEADATASIAATAPDRSNSADTTSSKPKAKIALDADVPVLVPDPALSTFSAALRELAMRGDSAAEFEVAVRLSDGRGVTRDLKDAAVWFERAAKQGLAPAQYRLGSMYEKGLGVTADSATAVSWYERAAAQGNIRAMHNLAVMSAEGSGAKPDYVKAVSWFTKAATLGVRDSQYNLAILYARGLGVTQNLGQAYAWFAIAAGQGDMDAGKKRDEVAAKLDAKSLTEAKSLADAFKPTNTERVANEVSPPSGGWDVASPVRSVSPGNAIKDVKAHANDT